MSTIQSGKRLRPLSPHLQIYRKQLTSTLSILHRATGVWLSLGLILVVDWLLAVADPDERGYRYFQANLDYGLGFTAVFCFIAAITFALFYRLEVIFIERIPGDQRRWLKLFFICLDLCVAFIIALKAAEGLETLSPDPFQSFCSCVGQLMLLAWTWAFFYHFCAGLRHLAWDAGFFLELKSAYATGWLAVVVSFLITGLIWIKIMGWQFW